MSKLNWLIALLCTVLCYPLYAQNQKTMGVDDMFNLADENSKSISSYHLGKEAADEALKAAQSQRLPDISASLSISYLGDGYLWDRNFKNGMNVPIPHFGNNFALEVQQVIYSGGAISSNITLAELGQKIAALDWQKNRQEIRFLLIGYYLDLCKLNNQLRVIQKNIDLTEKVIQNMQARYNQGAALQCDITRYELQQETLKLQLSQTKDAKTIINHQLVTTLHLSGDTEIIPDTTFFRKEIHKMSEVDWQQMAAQENLNLRQAELSTQVSNQQVKLAHSERLPQIAFVATDNLNGPITIEVPALNNNFNYWYIGIGVKYNISSLFKNNRKLRQAHLNARRSQTEYELTQEQIENAVHASYINFLTAFTDLNTQMKSVELANENYRVIDYRYKNDLALLTDMLDASNTKLNADLGLVNARINLIFNYYKMRYITHTL